ncbi:MAG: tail fiber domain-containing protein, partial [Bacteroidia bacterium]|nr:tail fiber domain-containing protein [Bacteroidia bacterium]
TSAAPGYNLVVNGTAAKTGGGSWSTLSDVRMKDLTGEYQKGLNEILQLKPVTFTYKAGNPRELNSNEPQIGFVAQDVQKIFPEAVTECKDGYLDFNIHAVNVALVNAVKELKAENQELKMANEKYEERLTEIENILRELKK